MILQELTISNFRSYYGNNTFRFNKGLTLIIGGNGDGKTTFFDALNWLFETYKDDSSISYVSEKRKSELSIGEIDEISVSLTYDHEGVKILEKRFSFVKLENGSVVSRDFSFQGYHDTDSGREMISGRDLLKLTGFIAAIRKYCLFKGESELDIFNDETALKDLVNQFSDISSFETFVDILKIFENNSRKARDRELSSNVKTQKAAKVLEKLLIDVNDKISSISSSIRNEERELNTYTSKIKALESHQESSEKYQNLKERLKRLEDEARSIRNTIQDNYNFRLLDDLWILSSFSPVFEEYEKKTSQLSKTKRKLREDEIEKRAIEKGKELKEKEIASLQNGATQLPWFLPNRATMQEMIDDKICKVCNRVAEEGSDALNFMIAKLEKHLQETRQAESPTKEKEVNIFPYNHIENLYNLSISFGGSNAKEITNISNIIRERVSFISEMNDRLKEVKLRIEETESEKRSLVIQSGNKTEDALDKSFKDLKGSYEGKGIAERKIDRLNEELNKYLKEKEDIDNKYSILAKTQGYGSLYSRIHDMLQNIHKAFIAAKEENLIKFLEDLENKANTYLGKLNTDDFHGRIRLIKTAENSININLYSSNNVEITNPNGALNTTKYMSVLFAISDLTTIKRESDYPLIFDAPTSSFEEMKEDRFYNVIDKINKQCIIVTKDLLEVNEATGKRTLNQTKIDNLTCSVYRIEKQRPFDQNDLSTICTKCTEIK